MHKVVVSEQAQTDLQDIRAYIAERNPRAAAKLQHHILTTFKALKHTPFMGQERPDIRKGMRFFPLAKYCVYYRVAENTVLILRVLHSARDILPSFLE